MQLITGLRLRFVVEPYSRPIATMCAMDATRVQEAKELHQLTRNVRATVLLEAFAFLTSAREGKLHGIVPVWSYASGLTLFETDRPEAHARERLASYLMQMAYVKAVVQERPDLVSKPLEIVHPTTTSIAYAAWLKDYHSGLARSKQVLQEHQDTGVFIQCKKCKSNDVDTEQKQTRSADEPMTLFCKCRRCETRFVMH